MVLKFRLKVIKKNIVFEKNYWKVSAAHDGYLKQYGVIHDREIEFYPEQMKFIGFDKLGSIILLVIANEPTSCFFISTDSSNNLSSILLIFK